MYILIFYIISGISQFSPIYQYLNIIIIYLINIFRLNFCIRSNTLQNISQIFFILSPSNIPRLKNYLFISKSILRNPYINIQSIISIFNIIEYNNNTNNIFIDLILLWFILNLAAEIKLNIIYIYYIYTYNHILYIYYI